MILHSGKAMIKNTKPSPPANTDEIKQDFISELPDVLLTQIISLLPGADANRTRILSNRWKNICSFLPNLRFIMPNNAVNKFYDSVEQTLALRDGMPIQSFYLHCSKNCDNNRVRKWLRSVVECVVQRIELSFARRFRGMLCWDLFKTCNTLVALTLRKEFELDVPESELLFPCLKKLDLVSILYSSGKSLANLISSCPVLEELYVERHVFFDSMQTFKVSSTSLKKLKWSFAEQTLSGSLLYASDIDAPNLEYLHIEDYMSKVYRFTNMPSLVEAHMSTSVSAAELLTCLSSVKTLTLTYLTLDAIFTVHGVGLTVFPNLVKLVIGVRSISHWRMLVRVLLAYMPNLDHITILDGLPQVEDNPPANWVPPVEVPACLRFKTKEIIILNQTTITQEEFAPISYLLKNSSILEKFTVNAHEIDPERREQLLKFDRGSDLCRIEFV